MEKQSFFAQNTGIIITQQPIDQTICTGLAAANFTVAARSGCDSPIDFQWLVSTDGGQDFTAAPTGKTASFQIPASVFAIFPSLKIKVRLAAAGCKPIESETVRLLSEGSIQLAVFPKKETAVAGGAITLEAKIESAPDDAPTTFQFQWQRSRYATGVWEDIGGATEQRLVLKEIMPDFNGNLFRVAVRGGGICDRAFSSPATLLVENAPLVNITPTEKTVCEHGTASFGVQIQNGTGKETVIWQVSRDAGKSWRDLPGENHKTFTAADLTADLSGSQFRAVVMAPGGLLFPTGAARLSVSGTVSVALQPGNYLACVGDSALFQVKARSAGRAATYQWQQSSDGGKTFTDIFGKTNELLGFAVDNERQNGQLFRAKITAGECAEINSQPARLDVVQPISFAQNNQYSFAEGKSGEIRTQPTPSAGTFIGQWQFSTDGGQTWSGVKDANTPILQLAAVAKTMDGRLFRYKMFSKECGRIHFSEPILLKVTGGR